MALTDKTPIIHDGNVVYDPGGGFWGYCRIADGTLVQWGYSFWQSPPGDVTIVFPVAFTNVGAIIVTPTNEPWSNGIVGFAYSIAFMSATGFAVGPRYFVNGGGVSVSSQGFYWMAVGR